MLGVLERPAGAQYHCALCGSLDRVQMRQYVRSYTPPWVYILLLVGLIPAAIVSMIVSTRHQLTVPFCAKCGFRHKMIPAVNVFGVLGIFALIIGGAAVAAETDSAAPFALAVVMLIALIIGMYVYVRRANPKYLTFNADRVVIHDVVHGPVTLFERYRTAPAAPAGVAFGG